MVPDTPRFVSWIGDGLIVCIKKDLYHLTVCRYIRLFNDYSYH